MERVRSLFGRIPWGSRFWTQEPIGQSPTSPAVLLIGLPRERSLVGQVRERTLMPRGEQ